MEEQQILEINLRRLLKKCDDLVLNAASATYDQDDSQTVPMSDVNMLKDKKDAHAVRINRKLNAYVHVLRKYLRELEKYSKDSSQPKSGKSTRNDICDEFTKRIEEVASNLNDDPLYTGSSPINRVLDKTFTSQQELNQHVQNQWRRRRRAERKARSALLNGSGVANKLERQHETSNPMAKEVEKEDESASAQKRLNTSTSKIGSGSIPSNYTEQREALMSEAGATPARPSGRRNSNKPTALGNSEDRNVEVSSTFLRHQRKIHEQRTGEMVDMVQQMKANAQAMGNILKRDERTLVDTHQNASTHYQRMKKEVSRVKLFSKTSWSTTIYIYGAIFIVCFTSVIMFLFIRLFPKT